MGLFENLDNRIRLRFIYEFLKIRPTAASLRAEIRIYVIFWLSLDSLGHKVLAKATKVYQLQEEGPFISIVGIRILT